MGYCNSGPPLFLWPSGLALGAYHPRPLMAVKSLVPSKLLAHPRSLPVLVLVKILLPIQETMERAY